MQVIAASSLCMPWCMGDAGSTKLEHLQNATSREASPTRPDSAPQVAVHGHARLASEGQPATPRRTPLAPLTGDRQCSAGLSSRAASPRRWPASGASWRSRSAGSTCLPSPRPRPIAASPDQRPRAYGGQGPRRAQLEWARFAASASRQIRGHEPVPVPAMWGVAAGARALIGRREGVGRRRRATGPPHTANGRRGLSSPMFRFGFNP